MKTTKVIIGLFFLGLSVISCSDDDTIPKLINETEVVTTVELAITDIEANTTQTVSWVDGVNDATNSPKITLAANKNYTTAIKFLNASNPEDIENVTEEIIAEKDDHYIFFTTENTLTGLNISSNPDTDIIDSDDIGINIQTSWTATEASTGTVTAFLIHEPTSKVGTARSAFGGETEAEVTFDVVIE